MKASANNQHEEGDSVASLGYLAPSASPQTITTKE